MVMIVLLTCMMRMMMKIFMMIMIFMMVNIHNDNDVQCGGSVSF